ncbi:MAG: choice-of-anchor tandem repeat GloVer-containing protein [Terriglobales bacterium]
MNLSRGDVSLNRRPSNSQARVASMTLRLVVMFALACVILSFAARTARAQSYSVLYTFCSQPNCTDGAVPNPSLIVDNEGNVFGTTETGGDNNFSEGTAFEITPSGVEKLLYSFDSLSTGVLPFGGLIRDAGGNFYGVTAGGGDYADKSLCRGSGCGTVYKLTPTGAETVLFAFVDFKRPQNYEGTRPFGPLLRDANGNLFGTVGGFGRKTAGAVFELTAGGSESVLHWFGSYKGDGKFPNSGLVMDGQGNLYGTTNEAGHYSGGTVFEINAAGVESILYSFGKRKTLANGTVPNAGLVLGANGNLYGTTVYGGSSTFCSAGCGTVFELTPNGIEKALYSFNGTPDGAEPAGSLIMDAQGNFYGTTQYGGVYSEGTVFKLTQAGVETVLYSFSGGADGGNPVDGLTMDAQGNLYGTTIRGGNISECPASGFQGGCGVVFKVTP